MIGEYSHCFRGVRHLEAHFLYFKHGGVALEHLLGCV